MDSFKLSDILAFLELKFGQALVLASSCFAAYFASTLNLVNFGKWTDTINAALFVFGMFATISVIWKIIHQIFVFGKNRLTRNKFANQIKQRLKSLSHEEKQIILECVYTNQQTFISEILDPDAVSLRAKKLVFIGASQVSILETPFTFYDHVWKILQNDFDEQGDEFLRD